uniref:Uncharacterized protein n=1 Tax=Acrobeloides nanus TaxID=290746 RepID=A0A914DNV5_9BILA
MSTGPWHGQEIRMAEIIELLEEEPLSLDPGLQYDVEGMVFPKDIEDNPGEDDENKYLWLKWHLNEEAILFRRELWDAEAMLDLPLFQQTLEDWHKKKDQILHAINLGHYRGNKWHYLMNVKVPEIPNPPGATTNQQNSTQGHDHYFEAFLNNTLHLHDGWPIPDPSPAQND